MEEKEQNLCQTDIVPLLLNLAGCVVPCVFEFSENQEIYGAYVKLHEQKAISAIKKNSGREAIGKSPVRVTEEQRRIFCRFGTDDGIWNADAEGKCMRCLVSDALLAHDRLLFHSVAFAWQGKAWLLTAPSGTGKTTQLRNLSSLLQREIQVICGDNPVLRFEENGEITVHSSPWSGKEGLGAYATIHASLGGIIYLRQAKENRFVQMEKKDAAYPIYQEINTFAESEWQIRKILQLEERMINAVPVWQFENTGTVEATARMVAKLTGLLERIELLGDADLTEATSLRLGAAQQNAKSNAQNRQDQDEEVTLRENNIS